MHQKTIIRVARIIFTLLAVILLIPALRAQPAPQKMQNRFLLVFDTSSAMKKRLPVTEVAVEKLFFSLMKGQLQTGDTIGVWTFAEKVGPGQFPLQQWNPGNAATIASNITAFVEHQRYRKSTDFNAAMLLLNSIVQDSDRLTVLIFCDGNGEMTGTPFDDDINKIFEENRLTLQKSLQPFIIVLRSQDGAYVGYTVGSSAETVGFPDFPPIPQPPSVVPTNPAPNPAPPPAPVVFAPSLIITGTNVGTNLPPPGLSVAQTNAVAKTSNASSNTPQATVMVETNPVASTNSVAPPPGNSGVSGGGALKICALLLVVAGVLAVLMIRRAHRARQSSLITRSMDKK